MVSTTKKSLSTCLAITFLSLLIFTQIEPELPVTKLNSWLHPLQAWTFNTVAYRMYAPFPSYHRDIPSISVSSGTNSISYGIIDSRLLELVLKHFKQPATIFTRATAERWGNFMLSLVYGLNSDVTSNVDIAKNKFKAIAHCICNEELQPPSKVALNFTHVEFGRFMEGPRFEQSRSVLIFDCQQQKFIEQAA